MKHGSGFRQGGAALLLFVLVLLVFGISIWLARARPQPPVPDSIARHLPYLTEAKARLLVHAVTNATQPGWLPFPDRNADGNYDGNGDCHNNHAAVSGSHLIGQWPSPVEQGCGTDRNAFADTLADDDGNRLWIAVSKNLVWNRSAIDDLQWLSVRTAHGIISDVAAVVISPGAALTGQDRSGTTANVAQFLDSVTLDGVTYSNADGDLQFVQVAPVPGQFNDELLFLRRSELMTEVTRYVAAEIKRAIDAAGPYPASLPDTITPWFDPFWAAPMTTYTQLSTSAATLAFAGCPDVIYQLSSGAALQWNGRC